MTVTVIPAALLARLVAAAAADPEREICGLLFGRLESIESARATANVAPDPARSFEIDPASLLEAYRQSRAGGPAVIGHYHSHPSGSAMPSERDRAAAQPGKLWLILAAGGARLWLAEPHGFTERSIRSQTIC